MSADEGHTERRPFEPPPWEREQFEELARRMAVNARDEEVVPPPEQDSPEPGSAEPAADERSADVDERAAAAMLLQLGSEDVSALVSLRRTGRALAWVLGVIGVVTAIAGIVAGARSVGAGFASMAAGGTIAVLGLMIAGSAAWLWIRANR